MGNPQVTMGSFNTKSWSVTIGFNRDLMGLNGDLMGFIGLQQTSHWGKPTNEPGDKRE